MILVFGGTGFIGKHLVSALAKAGRAVTVVSRTPDEAFLAREAPGATALTAEAFAAAPQDALQGCQGVVYLAARSVPGSNLDTPSREVVENVEPAFATMQEVARQGAHFVFLSSGGAIYGQHQETTALAESVPPAPISPYGVGKEMIEAAIRYTARAHGLRATVLRPSNPIGRWQTSRAQGVVGALMRAADGGEPFLMFGDGSSVRDYLAVEDLVTAITETLDRPEIASGRTWNVGSGRGHSLSEMIALTEAVSGRRIKRVELPARPSDPERVVLDIGAIRDALGWEPKHPLEDCLADIWQTRQTGG